MFVIWPFNAVSRYFRKSAAILLVLCSSANAAINSPDNCGDIQRATAMLADNNYIGTLDQLLLVDYSVLTSAEREMVSRLRCEATAHINHQNAARLISDFLDNYPASSWRNSALVLLGDCLLDESPADALAVYDSVDRNALTIREQNSLDYHRAYAMMMIASNEDSVTNRSVEMLDRAVKLFESSAVNPQFKTSANFYIGYIAYLQNDYPRAISFLEKADRSELPGTMADYYLAQIYYARADYDRALRAADNILERTDVAPEYVAEATRVAGESMMRLGNENQGVKYLEKYLSLSDSPAPSAFYLLGTYAFNHGNSKKTVEMLRKAIDAVGNEDSALSQSSYLYMGQADMLLGDYNAALLAFDRALHSDADADVKEAAYYNYAVAKFSGARLPFGNTAATFEEFLRLYPSGKYSAEVREYLIDGYISEGNYDTALTYINGIASPTTKVLASKQRVLYALGNKALSENNPAKALVFLTQAEGLPVSDKNLYAEIALSKGEALYRTGKAKEAVPYLRRYIAEAAPKAANMPLARYDLGYALFALRDYNGAAKSFSDFATSPGTLGTATLADALNRLGDSKLYAGDFANAEKAYDRAFRTNPAAGDYPLFQKAVIAGYQRKYKDKIRDIEELLEAFPSSSLVPDALLEMTEGYIQLGDNESAVATYRRLVTAYPSTEQGRRGYLQMALTLLNSGHRNEAVAAYRDVVTLYPTSEEAYIAVDELKRLSAEDASLPEFAAWLGSVENAPKMDISETDRLMFENAEKEWLTKKNSSRLSDYMTQNPSGSFRAQALGYLIDGAVENGNYPAVVEFTSDYIKNYPDAPQVENIYIAKAEAEFALGDAEAALKTWTELETRASTSRALSKARYGIVRSALIVNDYPRVIAAADALLSSSTRSETDPAEAEFARAYALYRSGRIEDAAPALENLAAFPENEYGAKSAYYLAEMLAARNDFNQALERLEHLTSSSPHAYWVARGFILMSDIFEAQGKKYEAREYLLSLRNNYPGNEPDIFNMIDERLARQ